MEDIAHFFTKLTHNIEKIFPFSPVAVHKYRKNIYTTAKNTYAHTPQEECIDRPMKNYHGLRKHRRGCHAYFSFSS